MRTEVLIVRLFRMKFSVNEHEHEPIENKEVYNNFETNKDRGQQFGPRIDDMPFSKRSSGSAGRYSQHDLNIVNYCIFKWRIYKNMFLSEVVHTTILI